MDFLQYMTDFFNNQISGTNRRYQEGGCEMKVKCKRLDDNGLKGLGKKKVVSFHTRWRKGWRNHSRHSRP